MSISNNPPPDATFGMHIDDLFSLLSDTLAGGEVSNDDQEAAIDGLLDDFRKASKDADKARKDEAKPFDDGKKAVQAKWTPLIDKASRGADECKAALTPYRTAKQAAKDAAARKLREEAEAAALAAQEKLRAADDLETKFIAEQQLEAAQKQHAHVNRVEREATGLRTYYEAEIADRGKALRAYLALFPERFVSLIQEMADQDARGGRPVRDGIVYHERKKAN